MGEQVFNREDNCTYCSEPGSDGVGILYEMTTWSGKVNPYGSEIESEVKIGTGRWMHVDCAYMAADEQRQIPGQIKIDLG